MAGVKKAAGMAAGYLINLGCAKVRRRIARDCCVQQTYNPDFILFKPANRPDILIHRGRKSYIYFLVFSQNYWQLRVSNYPLS